MVRLIDIALAAIIFVQIGCATPLIAGSADVDKVQATIDRTKHTRTTYAIYFWNRIQHPGQPPIEEWSAEFNADDLHRVETPRDRVIANCAAQTGTYFSPATENTFNGAGVAGVACGINTNRPFLSMEALGRVATRFGDADRVRVTDAENIRTYDISDEGMILHTLFETNDTARLTVLDVETVAVSRQLPALGIFDLDSLKDSVVPSGFKVAPKPSLSQ